MSNISFPRDNNRITVIGGVSSTDGVTPTTIYVDPTTHRLYVNTNSAIIVGTTTISGGTNGNILYDNNGVVGEKATTGSGNVVLATSPTLVTPTLGVATATSINGLTITSSTGTLTIASGKTLTQNNSMIFGAADDTGNYTFPTGTATLLATNGSGASLTNVVNSITGTANQVIASASTGAVTLSLPQSIATTSTPTFGATDSTSTAAITIGGGTNVGNYALGVSGGRAMFGYDSGGQSLVINSATSKNIAFYVNAAGNGTFISGTEALFIVGNSATAPVGSVGINNNAPGGRLHVTAAANEVALKITGYSLTGSNASNLIDVAGTWNTTGVATALKINVTNTASGTGSNLMDLQIGSSSQFTIDKNGKITKYAGSAPTDGQIPIGSTANGNLTLATITAGSNITVTNGSNSITIAASSSTTTAVMVSFSYENSGRYVSTVSNGTNTFGSSGLNQTTTATGTSYAQLQYFIAGGSSNGVFYNGSPKLSTIFQYGGASNATGDNFWGIGTPTISGSAITFTDKHIGEKLHGNGTNVQLFGTQADGTTEAATSALVTVSQNDVIDWYQTSGASSTTYYYRQNAGSQSAGATVSTHQPTTASSSADGSVTAETTNDAVANAFNWLIGSGSYSR